MNEAKYYCRNKNCKNGDCSLNTMYAAKGLLFLRNYENTEECAGPMVAKRKFIHFWTAFGSSTSENERIFNDWLRDIKIVKYHPEKKKKPRYAVMNYKTGALIDDANGKGFSSWKHALDTYISKCTRGEYGVKYK